MEISACSNRSYNAYKKFFNVTNKWWDPFCILLLAICVFFIVVIINSMVHQGAKEYIALLTEFAILGCVIVIMMLSIPKISYKRTKNSNNLEEEFTFSENGISVCTKGQGFSSETIINYQFVLKICETKEFYFIYINRVQAYIVDKSTLAGGTNNQLHGMLVSMVGMDRYNTYLNK